MMKIISNPDYHKHAERCREDYNPCIICGRAAGKTAKFVRVHKGGAVVVTSEEAAQLDSGGDMGLQPVGLKCLALHPELEPYISEAKP